MRLVTAEILGMNPRRTILLLLTSVSTLAANFAAALETISPTDSNLLYTGRFNTTNPSRRIKD